MEHLRIGVWDVPESIKNDSLRNVDVFCERNGISRALYYKLRKAGLGPQETKIGRLTKITPWAEDRWRRQRESATH